MNTKNQIQKRNFWILFISIIFLFSFCVEDASIPMGDAYHSLYQAIDYKYKECGEKPQEPLYPPAKVSKYSLKLCSLAILRSDCPFSEYPVVCYDMFLKLINK